MVICLERDADLHMAQLMPLPLTVSCFGKIQIGFTSLVPAHLGSPGQRAVKRVCVCLSLSGVITVWVGSPPKGLCMTIAMIFKWSWWLRPPLKTLNLLDFWVNNAEESALNRTTLYIGLRLHHVRNGTACWKNKHTFSHKCSPTWLDLCGDFGCIFLCSTQPSNLLTSLAQLNFHSSLQQRGHWSRCAHFWHLVFSFSIQCYFNRNSYIHAYCVNDVILRFCRKQQQSGRREKQKAKTRNDIKNWRQRYKESSEWINSSSWKACAWN